MHLSYLHKDTDEVNLWGNLLNTYSEARMAVALSALLLERYTLFRIGI